MTNPKYCCQRLFGICY